eukprot:7379074-Prymnesium_polylepis.1
MIQCAWSVSLSTSWQSLAWAPPLCPTIELVLSVQKKCSCSSGAFIALMRSTNSAAILAAVLPPILASLEANASYARRKSCGRTAPMAPARNDFLSLDPSSHAAQYAHCENVYSTSLARWIMWTVQSIVEHVPALGSFTLSSSSCVMSKSSCDPCRASR